MNMKHVSNFGKGLRIIKKHNKLNFLDLKGNLTLSEWVENAFPFHGNFALVEKNEDGKIKKNFVNSNGKLISKIWFDELDISFGFNFFSNGKGVYIADLCLVTLNKEYNLLHISGFLVFKEWKKTLRDF